MSSLASNKVVESSTISSSSKTPTVAESLLSDGTPVSQVLRWVCCLWPSSPKESVWDLRSDTQMKRR